MDLTYLYVIGGSHGMVKIGVSANPSARLRSLQTGSPHRLHLAYSQLVQSGDAYAAETEAHSLLHRHRQIGEWFAVPAEVAVAAVSASCFRSSQTSNLDQPRWWLRSAIIAACLAPTWAQSSPSWFVLISLTLTGFWCAKLSKYRGPIGREIALRWIVTAVGAIALSLALAMPFASPTHAEEWENTKARFSVETAIKLYKAKGLADVQEILGSPGRITERASDKTTYQWVSNTGIALFSFFQDGSFGGSIRPDKLSESITINSSGAFVCDACRPQINVCGAKPTWVAPSEWSCDGR